MNLLKRGMPARPLPYCRCQVLGEEGMEGGHAFLEASEVEVSSLGRSPCARGRHMASS